MDLVIVLQFVCYQSIIVSTFQCNYINTAWQHSRCPRPGAADWPPARGEKGSQVNHFSLSQHHVLSSGQVAVQGACQLPAAVPYLASSDERSVLPTVLPLVLSTALLARARWYSVAAGLGDLAQATHTNATPANGSGDQERRGGIGSPLHHSGPIDRQS